MRKCLALEILGRILIPCLLSRWILGLFLRTVSLTANERGRNDPLKLGTKALISNKQNTAMKQDIEQ